MATPFVAQLPRLFASSPLRHAPFRVFYLGSIGVAIGYTMQATVAAWLMATLTPSAFMVALVQTASTAPSMLFGLFAGALADIVERRRIILSTQIALLASSVLLGVATLAGVIGPATLLLLTFIIGAGFAFYTPAQQASINELVSRADLARAVALGSVAFNVARAIGPALAGAIAAWIGTGSALLASSFCFVPMVIAIRRWPRAELKFPGVPETILSGVMSGLRFARHSTAMRAFVIRNLTFAICASAFWALLPVIARDQLGLGAGGFGLLSAAFGTGAVTGALLIPGQMQRKSLNSIVKSGIMLWIVAIVLIAVTVHTLLALVGAFGAGMAWVTVFATLSAGTQSSAPAWVRARAVGMNLVAVQAMIALGSAAWGAVASGTGTRVALGASAALMLLLYLANRRVRVQMGSEADITPSLHLTDLAPKIEPLPDDGPVLIQIEYQIDPANRREFLRAIQAVGGTRRRNGAASWRVYRDISADGRFVERFVLTSWSEYVRLRTRMTVSDRTLQERVEALQSADVPLRISRLIGVNERDFPH
ncbi:MAG TPA: MFS transporter [Casimicrobiaceae bacterium]|nr:MFS transporter [Casimicrobiaceae bacterium]